MTSSAVSGDDTLNENVDADSVPASVFTTVKLVLPKVAGTVALEDKIDVAGIFALVRSKEAVSPALLADDADLATTTVLSVEIEHSVFAGMLPPAILSVRC
jgi:hypothetical protein